MEVTLGGLKIRLDFGFPALLALILLASEKAFLLQTLLVCILHECGHGIAMCATGAGLREIRFGGAGIQMVTGTAAVSRRGMLCISLAGPAVNLLFAALLARICPEAAMLHLGIGVFNLLPYRCLDGGTAIRLWWDSQALTWLCGILTAVLLSGLLFFRIANPVLYLLLVYLMVNESLR